MKIILLMWTLAAPNSDKAVPYYVAKVNGDTVCLDIALVMNARESGAAGARNLYACHSEADAALALRKCQPNGCAK